MKRALIQNVKVIPCADGEVVDREGYLSAIFAANVSAGTLSGVKISHSDTADGTFEEVGDPYVVVKKGPEADVEAPATVNFDLDLVGCKQFIKVEAVLTGDGAAATYAVALGDAVEQPV